MSGPELTELEDDSEALVPYVSSLRRAALLVPELVPETVPETVPEPVPEPVPETVPETVPEPVPETVPGPALSHGFLLKFLRARDFDVELSLKMLVNYQRWRRNSPEISSCLSPQSVLGLLGNAYHGALPLRDHSGSRVLLYRIGQWNPGHWSAIQVFRVSLMTSELIAMETQTQRRGVKVIFDLQGWCLGHTLQVTPSLAQNISSVLMDSFPLKVRGIHLLNLPLFFRPVLMMIRPFLPDKIRQRIHVHGSDYTHSLGHFFPPSVLPPEYGGEGPCVEEVCQVWTNQLLQSEGLLQRIAAHPTGDVDFSHASST